jgi:hypothetical protein
MEALQEADPTGYELTRLYVQGISSVFEAPFPDLLTTLVSYPPEAADTGNFEAVPTHLFAKAPSADSDDEEDEDKSNSDEEETEVNRDRPVALSRPEAETFADVVESSGGRRAKRTYYEESTPTKRRKVSKLQLQSSTLAATPTKRRKVSKLQPQSSTLAAPQIKEEIPKTPVKTSASKKLSSAAKKNAATKTDKKKGNKAAADRIVNTITVQL